jgi:hypothetical protein
VTSRATPTRDAAMSGRPRRRRVAATSAAGVVILATVVAVMASAQPGGIAGDRSGSDGNAPTLASATEGPREDVAVKGCAFWVSPDGADGASGDREDPWATLAHAAEAVPDRGCTVWFEDGVYRGNTEIERRMERRTTFRAVHPYHATFEGHGYVLDVSGSSRMMFRGLVFRHDGPGAKGIVVYADGADTDHLTFRDDILHDSYDDDVLKILDGATKVRVRGCLLFNQGNNEQLIDVNSVTDVTISDSIFFNDFAASGRPDTRTTKHYIVVKDSNGTDDRYVGSDHITIQRNIMLNWQGGLEAFLAVGNDGKPYFEAMNVDVLNNLIIGNGTDENYATMALHGARDVTFANNTIVGDLPTHYFGFDVGTKGRNPTNENVTFANNIWADPSGTMDVLSNGLPSQTNGLVLAGNLFWNGVNPVPGGDLVTSTDDPDAILRNPGLNYDQADVVLPYWNGSSFPSGEPTIRAEFVRLVLAYGRITASSPAVGSALPAYAPRLDILRHVRDDQADVGAYEA